MSFAKNSGFLPSKLYKQMAELMPIVSVEAVITIDNALLFFRRNNEPAKGEWWFPGGRIKKGESIEGALRREIIEETGLEMSEHRLVKVYSRIFPERHDITIVYLCKCKLGKITLNSEHSEYSLKNIFYGLHPYILEVIEDCKKELHTV